MPLPYDEPQKTRIYRRDQPDTQATGTNSERIGFTQPLTAQKGMFDGISIAQVVAGAAAAATSMLLASKIGIAGSVIGAAVSSAVTIICSQLYRQALEKSAERLKLSQAGAGTDGPRERYRGGAPYPATPAGAVYGARVAPAALRRRAAEERRDTQRKVLVFSIALAAAAVALTAGAILLSTAGEGIGVRPEPPLAAPEQQQPSGAGAADGTQGNAADTRTDRQDGADQSSSNAGADTEGSNTSTGSDADQGNDAGNTSSDSSQDTGDDGDGEGDSSGGANAGGEAAGGAGATPDANTGTTDSAS